MTHESHWSPPFDADSRRPLSFRYSRQGLFDMLRQEVRVAGEGQSGIPGFSLADLGRVPDDYLRLVVPVIVPHYQIMVVDGWVWGRLSEEKRPSRLFPIEQVTTVVFNIINGEHDLGAIACRLGDSTDWDDEYAFAYVRSFFLYLVQAGVCRPR